MPAQPKAKQEAFHDLVRTMSRLRRECPWDREQTSRSIMPYLIEETYEVLEALEHGDPAAIRSELGDLLLQILFHAELASERGEFDVYDVADGVREKMVRRHPHVFGDVQIDGADAVLAQWARIKAEERRGRDEDPSVLTGVPRTLPALLRAERLGEKASRIGFDWKNAGDVLEKLREEVAELETAAASAETDRIAHELGDCLFALASFGRKCGLSAELALGRALDRFVARFRFVEDELARRGRDVHDASLEEMEALWQEAKLTHG